MSGQERRVPIAEAARLTGRTPATLRSWIDRGLITPVARGPRNSAIFSLQDLWDVEAGTRARNTRQPQP